MSGGMLPWSTRNLALNGMNKMDDSEFKNAELGIPRNMTDRGLMANVCEGAKCTKCECLRQCEYGKEAVRRGLTGTGKTKRVRSVEYMDYPKERGGLITVQEISNMIGVCKSYMAHLISRAKIKPVARNPYEIDRGRSYLYRPDDVEQGLVCMYAQMHDEKHMNRVIRSFGGDVPALDESEQVTEKPEGTYTKAELQERWDMSASTVDKWISRSGLKTEYKLKTATKCQNLYDEKAALDHILEWLDRNNHTQITRRQFERLKREAEKCC